MQTGIDYTALFYDVTRRQLRDFKRSARYAGEFRVYNSDRAGFGFLKLFVPASIVTAICFFSTDATWAGGLLLLVPLVLAIPAAILGGGPRWREVESHFRYDTFARTNGLVYLPYGQMANYPGVIFDAASAAAYSDSIRSASGRELDISNYGSDSQRRGYMAIRLDRKLPHMVLDSRENGSLFMPGYVPKDQVLSLEGDFDQYFTLYCPREYERDALYFFTPDLMALLIDHAAPFDVEIIDDWMFVYSSDPFTATGLATYHRLFQIVATVGKKALSQTARYADDRAGDYSLNLVAAPGQRLRIRGRLGFTIFLGSVLVAFIVIITSSIMIDSRYR